MEVYMSKLYIVRHGKTSWNEKGLLQGSNDISLNEEGIKQAQELASKLDLSKIDICISSPLIRAKQTAEILVGNKLKIIYDDLLKERGFGNYEGKKISFELIGKHWDYRLNDSHNGIESIKDCLDRAKIFLDKIKKEYPNKNILIVSHFAFIKALYYNINGYDKNTNFTSFRPENATLYEFNI